jgi:selenocysteine lyase/cysteine desulfurase
LIDYKLDLLDTANKFETGTLPRLAIIVLNSSLEFFGKCDYDYINQRILNNSLYLAERLREIGIKTVLEKINDQNIAGIISIKFENPQDAIKKLEAENIICSLREGLIRISPHFYNDREDLDYLVEELKNMLN